VGIIDAGNNLTNGNLQMYTKKGADPMVEGSSSLFDEFRAGSVVFTDGTTSEDVILNCDYYIGTLYITYEEQEFFVDINLVESFSVKADHGDARHFVVHTIADKPVLFEVLNNGKTFDLLQSYQCRKIRPSYNPVLQSGSKNFRLETRSKFYVREGQRVVELPRSRRKLKKMDDIDRKLISEMVKNKVDLKSADDLVEFFETYNT